MMIQDTFRKLSDGSVFRFIDAVSLYVRVDHATYRKLGQSHNVSIVHENEGVCKICD